MKGLRLILFGLIAAISLISVGSAAYQPNYTELNASQDIGGIPNLVDNNAITSWYGWSGTGSWLSWTNPSHKLIENISFSTPANGLNVTCNGGPYQNLPGSHWANYTISTSSSVTCIFDATNCGEVYELVFYIVEDPPVADFTCSPLSGTAPQTVTCTDESTNNPNSWSWYVTYEDGTESSEITTQNFSINLYDAGDYTVNLTATNDYGSDLEEKTDYITLTNATTPTPTPTPTQSGLAPIADFSGSPRSASHAPLTVSFYDESTNNPTSWLWEFGDGWGSVVENPTHTYASAGTYTVSLTASNGWGNDQETKTGYVVVAADDDDGAAGTGYVKGHTYTSGDYNSLIGGVTVTLYNDTWSVTTTSSTADGYYRFIDVATGSYYVNGTKSGYSASSDYVVTVYADTATTQDIALISTSNVTPTVTPTQVVYAHMVRFTFRDINDNPFEGVNVTATMEESTSPWSWLANIFGFVTTEDPKNVTLSGTTGTDGSWSALMIANVRYSMHAWDNDTVDMTWSLYPQESDYLYIIAGAATPDRGENVAWNLTHEYPNSSHVRVRWVYNDTMGQTLSFRYWIVNQTDPKYPVTILDTTTSGSSFNLTYTLENTKGVMIAWGFEAQHQNFGTLEKAMGLTMTGAPQGRLVEIGLNDDEYLWLCMSLVIGLAAMFSSYRKVMLGAVLVPLFAGLLWYIGWFEITFAVFIAALVFGVMVYLQNREIRTGI